MCSFHPKSNTLLSCWISDIPIKLIQVQKSMYLTLYKKISCSLRNLMENILSVLMKTEAP